tara:strand:+ start:1661 stop:1987 length:327 start_codon:yes stop_codon:yes gene_type:complete
MVSIGRMRYPVTLQSPTVTRDAGGGLTESYTTLATLFADIRPVSGSEKYRQGKLQESVTHEIIVRYRSDIATNYRIVYESRNFNIRNIRNIDERDRFLKLICTEGEAI